MSTSPLDSSSGRNARGNDEREQEIHQVRDALRGLRYGAVLVIVQDGVVVQIERTEKRRLRGPKSA
ncbi:MAG: YezD family protein [Pirellulales bacterium]